MSSDAVCYICHKYKHERNMPVIIFNGSYYFLLLHVNLGCYMFKL